VAMIPHPDKTVSTGPRPNLASPLTNIPVCTVGWRYCRGEFVPAAIRKEILAANWWFREGIRTEPDESNGR